MRLFAWILTAGAASVTACGDSLGGTDGSGDSTSGTSTADTTSSVPTTTDNPTTGTATDTTTSESTSSTSDTTPTTTTPTTTTGPVDCDVLDDCVAAASECRLALACDAGACVYEDAPAGTPVAAQTAGDCTVLACDGAGAVAPLPDPADVEDDGVSCTLDACDGTTPTHTPGMTACYSGPDGTAGVGACTAGAQTCDENGPTGPCVGEAVPQLETCDAALVDEDCDGLANEDGPACVCTPDSESACYGGPPGTQGVGLCQAGTHTCAPDGLGFSPCTGEVLPGDEDCDAADIDEDCDGLADESGPSCTCGDGDVSDGEACDDGNNVDGDGCSADCQEALKAVQIGTGQNFSCALFSHGKVKCWGRNVEGQLGLGDTEYRGDQPGEMGAALPFIDVGGDVAEIAVGSFHVCARLVSGAVKCWGSNGDGQLGLGDTNDRGDQPGEMGNALPAVQLGGGAVAELGCGNSISCARFADGSVKCWGIGGALGLGDKSTRGDQPGEMGNALPTVPIGAASALDVGFVHSCVRLTANGQLKCWGSNVSGELGIGSNDLQGDMPGEVAALPIVDLAPSAPLAVVAALGVSCAHMDNMTVRCWGSNNGLGDTMPRGDQPGEMGVNLPAIDVGGPVEKVFDVGNGGCVRLVGGAVKCWGFNASGRLGLGDTEHRGDQPGEMGAALPALDFAGEQVVDIDGHFTHRCALFADGAVRCWGANAAGALGQGDTENRGDEPGEMGAALPAIDLL